MRGEHLIEGEFQSDKYPTTPRGKVPLSCKDPTAQDLLWQYAQRRRAVDAGFSDDLEEALQIAGYTAGQPIKPADLPAPDTIIDYGDAGFCPLFAHYLPEGCDIRHAATEAGFECRFLNMDDDLPDEHPVYVDYFEYGSAKALREWQPTQQGDGWKLVGQWDTEDGPTALFVRPLPPPANTEPAAAPDCAPPAGDGAERHHREPN